MVLAGEDESGRRKLSHNHHQSELATGSYVANDPSGGDGDGGPPSHETPPLYYFARKNRHLVRSTVKATAKKENRQRRER
jgi:hypothetical protein